MLRQLRDKGNTVLVVEHKPESIAIADHVVDLGPRAGTEGGEVVFEGTVEGCAAATPSPAGTWTTAPPQTVGADPVRDDGGPRRHRPQPAGRRRRHPLGVLVVVTGVAGSGKSS